MVFRILFTNGECRRDSAALVNRSKVGGLQVVGKKGLRPAGSTRVSPRATTRQGLRYTPVLLHKTPTQNMATVHQPESVLVTGGCGFLGSHVVELLLKRFPGIKVAVMDLRVTSNTFDDVIYYAADLTSADDTRSVIRQCRPDVIIHTASPVFQTVNARTRALMYKVNVEGTKTLLGEAKKAGVKAFVYTSSASVVGNARNDLINADEQYLTIRGSLQHEYYSDTKVCSGQRRGKVQDMTDTTAPGRSRGHRP